MQDKTCKRVLAAIPDLFFGSKVSAAAGRLDISVQFAGSRQALLDGAMSRPDLIIVDLEGKRAILSVWWASFARSHRRAARAWSRSRAMSARGLQRAREAGYDEVLTRGGLAAGLPDLLASL